MCQLSNVSNPSVSRICTSVKKPDINGGGSTVRVGMLVSVGESVELGVTVISAGAEVLVFDKGRENAWQAKRNIAAVVNIPRKDLFVLFPFLVLGGEKRLVFVDSSCGVGKILWSIRGANSLFIVSFMISPES